MHRLLPLVLSVLLAVSLMTAVPASADNFQVSTVGLTFSPTPLTIQTGDTVDWNIGISHNVVETEAEGSCTKKVDGFQSGASDGDTSVRDYSLTFNSVGTFYYKCNPHCFSGMRGVIIVEQKVATDAPSWSKVKALYEAD